MSPKCDYKCLYKREAERDFPSGEGKVEIGVMCYEGIGRAHKPRNEGGF